MKANILVFLAVLFICLGCNEKEETHEIGETCKNPESTRPFCNAVHTSVVTCDKTTNKYVEIDNCAATGNECYEDWVEGTCTLFNSDV